jgi:hypothetical protein
MAKAEFVVKGWQVHARDAKGRLRAVGRRYSSEETAKIFRDMLLKVGDPEYAEPAVQVVQGFEPDDMK